MAEKKYMSLERLKEYDALIKSKIDEDIATHTHSWNDLEDKPFEMEAIVSERTVWYEESDTANSTGVNLSNFREGKYLFDIEGKDVIVTLNNEEYESVCTFSGGTSSIEFGDYKLSQGVVDDSIVLSGLTVGETYDIKIETIEKENSIPDEVISKNIARTTYVDGQLETKADINHNHDSAYEAKGAVTTAVDTHNVATDAHNDIRVSIADLETKVNNFLDVDSETTDQLSEVLTLIDNNKGTLESLTTTKVNVSDIIDNLTTASADKVLSANQGVAIKALIDNHTHSWNDLEDKPFGEDTSTSTIFSGDVEMVGQDVGDIYFTSAYVPTGLSVLPEEVTITVNGESTVVKIGEGSFTYNGQSVSVGCSKDDNGDWTVLQFRHGGNSNYTIEDITIEAETTVVKTIDPKYIDNTYVDNKIAVIQAELDSYEEITSEEIQSLFA